MAELDNCPGQGLVLADSLPLRWRAADTESLAGEAGQYHENNDEVLRFIAALEDSSGDLGEEHQPILQEITRLETKVNLVLTLMGQLLAVHFPLPPRRSVRLGPFGMDWMADSGPQVGDTGAIELWLSTRCPRPLILAGEVERVERVAQGGRYVLQFTRMAEPLRERLEKIIFRHHRRSIALSRRPRHEG